jgi:SAM-dependent methyltransferase
MVGLSRTQRHSLVGPPDLWEHKRKFQYEFLLSVGLKPSHNLLDLGCGVLRGGIPLIAYLEEGRYTGIEVRSDVLAEAKLELQENGLESKLPALMLCSDLMDTRVPRTFDFAWAFSVLIHMDDATLEAGLHFVSRHLATGGWFFANVHTAYRPDSTWQGLPLVSRSFEFYSQAFGRNDLQIVDLGPLSAYGHQTRGRDVASEQSNRMLLAIRTGSTLSNRQHAAIEGLRTGHQS